MRNSKAAERFKRLNRPVQDAECGCCGGTKITRKDYYNFDSRETFSFILPCLKCGDQSARETLMRQIKAKHHVRPV